MKLHGVDFTSAPCRRKPITVATGVVSNGRYLLESLTLLNAFSDFEEWLTQPGPWLGVFDLPFSLPRELITTLGWPTEWAPLINHFSSLSRQEIRGTFKAYCDAREKGNKFAHRATESSAGSSSSMKWVNPPVTYMLHAGAPRLMRSGVTLHGIHSGDPNRVALEGYPGMVARSITKTSYKSDEISKQTDARRRVRIAMLESFQSGAYPLGVALEAGEHLTAMIEDGTGDLLDATICGLLAAWAWEHRMKNYGLPAFDPLEGWIVGA